MISDYEKLGNGLKPLRAQGMRLAIDDAGAGFAGLHQILALEPDVIKLDMALIRDIDTDIARQALAGAMLTFARKTGAVLVAEGIETQEELQTLQDLGFSRGQGYLLGKPMPARQAIQTYVLDAPIADQESAVDWKGNRFDPAI